MARKIPKWLNNLSDEPKEGTELRKYFGSDASVLMIINGKKVTVWYRKWFDNVFYKYQVGGFRKSPDLTQETLIQRLSNIKAGGGRR